LRGDADAVYAVALSGDGKWVAFAGAGDFVIRVRAVAEARRGGD
jgi:hypothetical protein